MARLSSVLNSLRTAEKELEKELAGIRAAISSLSFGSAASMVPATAPRPLRKARKKRTMSAEARERIAAAQRARWARQKKAAKG